MLAHIAIQRRAYIFSANQIRLHCVRHLTCERAWFGLVLFRCLYCVCHFGFKNILIYPELAVLFSPYSTCEVIPKLSINMETYFHLVCSQIPHIFIT